MPYFSREMQLALVGELDAEIGRLDRAVLLAARDAARLAVELTKDRMRAMVTRAGLGQRLANTVRGEVYPKHTLARAPAGWIYVAGSAVNIFEAFETGATIRAGSGKMLTIPIPGSPADRKNFVANRTAKATPEYFRQRGVELSIVPGRNGRPSMLVAQSVRLGVHKTNGRVKLSRAAKMKSGGYGAGVSSVPLFWLVEEAKMPRKLDWGEEFNRATGAFLNAFGDIFPKALAAHSGMPVAGWTPAGDGSRR